MNPNAGPLKIRTLKFPSAAMSRIAVTVVRCWSPGWSGSSDSRIMSSASTKVIVGNASSLTIVPVAALSVSSTALAGPESVTVKVSSSS